MQQNISMGSKLRRFIPYYKKYIGILILDLFCASLTTVCEIVLPLIVRQITNLKLNVETKKIEPRLRETRVKALRYGASDGT